MHLDLIYRALADEVRRTVLTCLQVGEGVSLSSLAETIAKSETTAEVASSVETLRVELYHVHIPILCDAGLLEYDDRRSVVALTELGSEVESKLIQPSLEATQS
ncbi:helix-turn-helix domain-containing protein [Haloarcula nitratireducens]|uniref:Helix-turn-helix domain-containing protein n=1 Tax=Haloarcula nitratireducens TaxID=2487749 RepID=A0AAW4P6D7_9EURY|nr:helix-turn-helix domain-containing protein [Halomicroarcula nitratireducens]MBX0293317.1 helix-turn-helix domain-containing protein [Halomicroarcula nitratireducens]